MLSLAFRRAGAFFAFLALMASVIVIGAPQALAHHPEITASAVCEQGNPAISYTATSWSTGDRGAHEDIRILVEGVEVDSGAFTFANDYTFSGTIDATAWEGTTVTVKALAVGPWGNTLGGDESRETTVRVPPGGCDEGGTTTSVAQPTTTVAQPTTTVAESTTTVGESTTTVGTTDTTIAELCTAVIGNYVWLDTNANGIQEGTEDAVPGVTVQLTLSDGTVITATVTDDFGHYEFPGLCSGVYRVRFVLPDLASIEGEVWTTQLPAGNQALDSNADDNGVTADITVVDGVVDMSWDAGLVGEAVLGTTVTTATTTAVDATTPTAGGGLAATSTTVSPVTASTLPFTGFELQTAMLLGLLTLSGGAALLFGARRRGQDDRADSLGSW